MLPRWTPKVFIASSSKALNVATAIQRLLGLSGKLDVRLWTHGSKGGELIYWLQTVSLVYDFAVAVITPDDATIIDPFPLLGTLRISTTIAIVLIAIVAWLIHSFLNRPKVADTLIETEGEMNKVTWPSWPETWAGSLAVGGMVLVLFVFLTGADLFLSWLMQRFVGGAS